MRRHRLLCRLIALAVGVLTTISEPAAAPLEWTWHYTGAGISASGSLTTNDIANSAGYFQIIGITGARNGVTIVKLQATGTAIPGNEPYAVDNLISPNGQHLTEKGFGAALADGTFINPFFAHARTAPSYLEFFSAPHPPHDNAGANHTELQVSFTANLTTPAGGTSGSPKKR